MGEIAIPVVVTIVLWWGSTGAILYVDGLPRPTHRWSLAVASLLALLALAAIGWTAADTSAAAAYTAFVAALVLWGWTELTFLTGTIAGPRRAPCPPDATGFRRFRLAASAIIDHELAIAAAGITVLVLTWDAANPVAAWTYGVLWLMRLSAKINLFLGVPNPPDAFLPAHLAYLGSYFRRRAMNPFMPVAMTAATIALVLFALPGFDAATDPFRRIAHLLPGTLLALGILEHWLMVLPIASTKLWEWGFASHRRGSATTAPEAVTSWEASMTGEVDAGALRGVLEQVAVGQFGQVISLTGTSRAGNGWIRFAVAHGRAELHPAAPRRFSPPVVTAIGRDFDAARLERAFAACAA